LLNQVNIGGWARKWGVFDEVDSGIHACWGGFRNTCLIPPILSLSWVIDVKQARMRYLQGGGTPCEGVTKAHCLQPQPQAPQG